MPEYVRSNRQKAGGNLATDGSRFTGLLFTLWFAKKILTKVMC